MRTCVRLDFKRRSITGQLQRALAKRDVLAVRSLAGELPSVPLSMAAEITVLLSERELESYAPAARRLLARLAAEWAIPLRPLADLAALLAELAAEPGAIGRGAETCVGYPGVWVVERCFAWKAALPLRRSATAPAACG